MRILQIGKYWPPQRGGMETLLRQYSEGLAHRGHRVRALVAATGPEEERGRVGSVDVWRCARYGEFASVPLCPSLPAAIRRSLVDLRPEVVHLHLPNPLAAASWMLFADRRPLVVTYHSDIVRQRLLLRMWAPWRDRLLGRARFIHTTSEALIESSPVLERFRDRCRAVPPGIDPAHWTDPDPARVREWRQRLGPGTFLFVGRLVYYKGLEVLLEALRGSDLRVAICGQGPLRARLERLAIDLGDRVRLLGEVDDDELPFAFAAAAGFVLPSVAASETFGVVQLEAMAAGLPLVVSRASAGVVSVHEGANSAVLVPPRDPSALRDAMLRVRDDDRLADSLREAGRALVLRRYDASRRLDELEALLLEAGRSTAA
jgi:glycosyltransferase involved in cell wall biosynthesis